MMDPNKWVKTLPPKPNEWVKTLTTAYEETDQKKLNSSRSIVNNLIL